MRRAVTLACLLALWSAAPAAAQRQADLCEGYADAAPPEWAPSLTPDTPTQVEMSETQVESADGTLVSVKVYRPTAFRDQRLPAILVMSPYHALLGYYKEQEDLLGDWADCITPYMLRRGYVVVLADMRGTHNTDGCFDFGGRGDQADGHAVVQWMASQGWSNGNVGMYGVSHVGMSQYAAAVTTPPALKAIIPIAPITSFYRYLYAGGVHYEINMASPAAYNHGAGGPPPTNVQDPNWVSNVLGSACGTPTTASGMNPDGTFTGYWAERDYPSLASRIRTPVFHVHGTLDENVKTDHLGAIWEALEANGVPRRLLVGPWDHSEPDVDHWHLHALRWYEHWLRGVDTGMLAEPAVTLIDQEKKVRQADEWPATGSGELVLEAGALGGASGSGSQSYRDAPGMRRPTVRATEGVRVIYTSGPFETPTRISGTPVMDIVAAADAEDTNLVVLLSQLEGEAPKRTYITRGYLDARLRDGLDRPKPVVPGEKARYRVELHPREWVVPAGAQLEVLVASTDSCAWTVDPECNSSGVVSDATAAAVTLFEGAGETLLRLPVSPLDAVIRKPAAAPAPAADIRPAAPRPPRLTAQLRRGRRHRVTVTGRAPARSLVTVRLLRGKRRVGLRRQRVGVRGVYRVAFRARGRLRADVRAVAPGGLRLRARAR